MRSGGSIEIHGLIGKEIWQVLTPPSFDLHDGFHADTFFSLLDRKSAEDHENEVYKAWRLTVVEILRFL